MLYVLLMYSPLLSYPLAASSLYVCMYVLCVSCMLAACVLCGGQWVPASRNATGHKRSASYDYRVHNITYDNRSYRKLFKLATLHEDVHHVSKAGSSGMDTLGRIA
jgi:hypothetical protein